jgi:hypothetical protein
MRSRAEHVRRLVGDISPSAYDMVAAQAAGKLYLFRIVHGEIHDWTMATNLHEKEQVPLRF